MMRIRQEIRSCYPVLPSLPQWRSLKTLHQGTGMVMRVRRVNTARLLSSASCQMRNVVRAVALPESD
jgi:hypothetical protein